MLRITAWSLVGLPVAATGAALAFAASMVAGDLGAELGWGRGLSMPGHALARPAVVGRIVGLGLLRLAEGDVWRPGAAAVTIGSALVLLVAPW